MSIANICKVYEVGKYKVKLIGINQEEIDNHSSTLPPPKPLLISTPCDEEGKFPVLVFFHGTFLCNEFYSQLIQRISSHGFIVVIPQLYLFTACDCTQEISDAAKTIDWLPVGLANYLPIHIQPNLSKLAIGGHSRGGKVAFALATGKYSKTSLAFSALLAVDPVDGTSKENQTNPPILDFTPHSLDLKIAVLVIGSKLGELKKYGVFPPCAPQWVNHKEFFDECNPPVCYLVARDYGHMDSLNDETNGIRGLISNCTCVNGEKREPMRIFVGGTMVAFLEAYLNHDMNDLDTISQNPQVEIPIALSDYDFQFE